MTLKCKIATIFGGTGFVGRHVVKRLAAEGYTVKVATRIPEQANFLKTCGNVGQVVPFYCNYRDVASLREAVEGADIVVNCIGILFEKKKNKFARLHAELPGQIAEAAARENVGRFVHISALGIEQATSKYAAAKRAGEVAVVNACPWATILRPSVIFGADDNFFNMFARLTKVAPALPLIGGGKTKFQPVFVGDVSQAVIAAILIPAIHEADPRGKIYELGGPEIVTLRQIYQMVLEGTGCRRLMIPVPFFLAKIKAAFLSLMPTPLLTPDQVENMKFDNIVSPAALTLSHLGVAGTGMGLVVPSYLEIYKAGGRFADKKTA